MPYFTEEVRRLLVDNKNIGFKLYTDGYSVKNSNPFMQLHADSALINGLEELDKRQGWRKPVDNLDLSKFSKNEVLRYLQNYKYNYHKDEKLLLLRK